MSSKIEFRPVRYASFTPNGLLTCIQPKPTEMWLVNTIRTTNRLQTETRTLPIPKSWSLAHTFWFWLIAKHYVFFGLFCLWKIACFASTLSLCFAAVFEPLHHLLPGLVLYNSFLFCIPNEVGQWLMHSHSTLYSQHLLQALYRFWLWPASCSAKTEKTLWVCFKRWAGMF